MDKLFSWAKKSEKKSQMAENKQPYATQQPCAAQQSYPTQQPYATPPTRYGAPSHQQPYAPQHYQPSQSASGFPDHSCDAMRGMPPPPPTYEQSLHHPVAHQNYQGPQQQQYAPTAPVLQHYGQVNPGPALHNYGQVHPGPVPHNYGYNNPAPVQVKFDPQPASTTQYFPGAFSAAARFDSGSQVRIPPPPPGVAPNAAQSAAAMGQNVVLGKKRSKFF